MSERMSMLPYGFARRHGVLMIEQDEHPTLIYRPGMTATTVAEVQRVAGWIDAWQMVDAGRFDQQLAEVYRDSESMDAIEEISDEMDLTHLAELIPETGDLLEQDDNAPIVQFINTLLMKAINAGASDIHIETYETRMVVRFRVDGVLREVSSPKRALAPLLVSRVKVMAKLDIAEKRLPQDGRIPVKLAGRDVDVRVSTIPTSANGERVVLRLLDKQEGRRDLTNLGMNSPDLAVMKELIKRPHGIILVTGPTGSGKSTTLYACLDQLNDRSRNILTVEDPIEYDVEGIGQTQVNPKADMTFAKGLRAILRQDPDVVMVGEIRDAETADISVQLSLTGHLVLSTIHTNTAIGALTRFANMGIQPYLLSNSIVGLIAQRLVRVLCAECREAYSPDEYECEFLNVDKSNPPTVYRARGCDQCAFEGYRGRQGIYEVVAIDDSLRRMIHQGASEMEMEAHVRQRGTGIREDGCEKILAGQTSIDEVIRLTMED